MNSRLNSRRYEREAEGKMKLETLQNRISKNADDRLHATERDRQRRPPAEDPLGNLQSPRRMNIQQCEKCIMVGSLRILLAHRDPQQAELLKCLLQQLEHDIVQVCGSAAELISLALFDPPDLIISSLELPDDDAIGALVRIGETHAIPAILITLPHAAGLAERAASDHIMAHLTEPVRLAALLPTIHLVRRRFHEFEMLQQEVASLREALSERAVIERAKSRLMRSRQFDEEQAYLYLRRLATDRRAKMVDVARRVLNDHSARIEMN
jgi:response regulator NasT